MKVQAKETFQIPNLPLFKSGEVYNVTPMVASTVIKRGLAVELKGKPKKEEKQEKKEETVKKSKKA